MFSFLSHSKLEKQSANDFYIGNLLCLPHSIKMNNKKTPSSSLVTHFHVYKCRFIYTSILQRWQNKRLRHFFKIGIIRLSFGVRKNRRGTRLFLPATAMSYDRPSSSFFCLPDMTSLLSEFLS